MTHHQPKKETMTSRERVLKALNHEVPDRVPIDLGGNQTGIHKIAYRSLVRAPRASPTRSRSWTPCQQLARPCEAVLERFHVDTRYIAAGRRPACKGGIVRRERDGRVWHDLTDEFGVRWSMPDDQPLLHGHHAPSAGQRHRRRRPRLSLAQGRRPGPLRRPARAGAADPEAKRPTPSSAASPAWSTKSAGTCAGWSSGSCDLLTEPEFCEAMLDQTLKFWLDWFRLFLDEVGDVVDVIMIGDDLAGQDGPAVQPGDLPPPRQAAAQAARAVHPLADAGQDLVPHLRLLRGLHPRPARQRHPHPQPGADQRRGTWTRVELKRRFGRRAGLLGRRRATPSTSCRAAPRPRSRPTSAATSRRSCPAAATSSTTSTTSRATCRRRTSSPCSTRPTNTGSIKAGASDEQRGRMGMRPYPPGPTGGTHSQELFQEISQNSGSESLRRYSEGRSEDSASRRSRFENYGNGSEG